MVFIQLYWLSYCFICIYFSIICISVLHTIFLLNLHFDELFQVQSTIKNSTYKPIVNLLSNHLVTIPFTWPIQTPSSTGIWLNKLFSRLQPQYHHARFVCILPRLPKWQSVATFSAGLVFSTIWHFLTIPGANVSWLSTY